MGMSEWNNEYDLYVGHYAKLSEKVDLVPVPEDQILVGDSDIGRAVDFKRIAVHHIV